MFRREVIADGAQVENGDLDSLIEAVAEEAEGGRTGGWKAFRFSILILGAFLGNFSFRWGFNPLV